MRELKLKPRVQIWVCVNERSHHELPSCTKSRSEVLIECIQVEIQKLPPEKKQNVWVNRSLCQGSCNPGGVSVVIEHQTPGPNWKPGKRYSAVTPADIPKLLFENL